jgi:hypothetical protein
MQPQLASDVPMDSLSIMPLEYWRLSDEVPASWSLNQIVVFLADRTEGGATEEATNKQNMPVVVKQLLTLVPRPCATGKMAVVAMDVKIATICLPIGPTILLGRLKVLLFQLWM